MNKGCFMWINDDITENDDMQIELIKGTSNMNFET